MASKTKKFYDFYQDLYHQKFVFLPNWEEHEIYRVFSEGLKPAAGAVFTYNGVILIWVKDYKAENIDYLVHECVHAANTLFQMRGHELSAKNDEAQAYLVQWIFNKCFTATKLIKWQK